VAYGGEEVDLCTCRTKASYVEEGRERRLVLDPVEIEFTDLKLALVSTFTFIEDTGEIRIGRRIVWMDRPEAEVRLNEYVTACYGTTEYPQDLTGVILRCIGPEGVKEIYYRYKCREERMPQVTRVEAVIPQIETRLSVYPLQDGVEGYCREGYAFSPMFTLGLEKNLRLNEEMVTCLKVARAE